jgi:DNA polymerase-1
LKTLLIDADITAYEVASSVEQTLEIEEGYFQTFCNFEEVKEIILDKLNRLIEDLDADKYALALTDSVGNYRKEIYEFYKGKRSTIKKPIVLKHVKQWMIDDLGAYWRPGLEGDDILGILATHPTLLKGEKVIVSEDKDLQTIPGMLYRKGELIQVTEEEAFRYFMMQTLTGDSTDGYPGLPGYGPVKAEKWLDTVEASTPTNLWRAVVDAYERFGMTEEDALLQARCARILTADLYDFANKKPILWTPPVS